MPPRGSRKRAPPPPPEPSTPEEEEEVDEEESEQNIATLNDDPNTSSPAPESEDEEDALAEEEADDADEEDEEDEMKEDEDEEDEDEALPRARTLKIKLKLPPSETATPDPPPRRRGGKRRAKAPVEVESEDSSDEVMPTKTSSRHLTTRQAVLAHVADAAHVALGASEAEQASKTTSPAKRRKKDLTESEIALRRAETARKRKDLSEKKLEDEKLETMNRLLKRKAGVGRGRKSAAAIAALAAGTPLGGESEVESAEREPEPATMYRWTSDANGIMFSVPLAVLLEHGVQPTKPKPQPVEGEEMAVDVPEQTSGEPSVEPSRQTSVAFDNGIAFSAPPEEAKPSQSKSCAVSGCAQPLKYRLVRDWTIGGCGLEHLRALEKGVV